MAEKDHIESLLKEAEVYQTQGLLKESKVKYLEILEIIKNNNDLSKDKHLIDSVNNKIRSAEDALDEVDKEPETAELSENVQNLITHLFAFSKDNDLAAIEGAVALATFGQYEKALAEFQRLLEGHMGGEKAGFVPGPVVDVTFQGRGQMVFADQF